MSMPRLIDLLDSFGSRRVAVIGDLIADEFIYGRVARVSREAPVLILQYDATEILPGGAGNAANNVAALGARTQLVALAGNDEPESAAACAFERPMSKGCSARAAIARPSKRAFLRVVCTRRSSRSCESIVWCRPITTTGAVPHLPEAALKAAGDCDAVLMSDYGTGLVTPRAGIGDRAATSTARDGAAGSDPDRFALRPAQYRGLDRVHARTSRKSSRFSTRKSATTQDARAGRPRAVEADAHESRGHHPRQPRDGGVRARSSDHPRARFTDPMRWPT